MLSCSLDREFAEEIGVQDVADGLRGRSEGWWAVAVIGKTTAIELKDRGRTRSAPSWVRGWDDG